MLVCLVALSSYPHACNNACRQHLGPRQRNFTRIKTKIIKVSITGCYPMFVRCIPILCIWLIWRLLLVFFCRGCWSEVQRSDGVIWGHKEREGKPMNLFCWVQIYESSSVLEAQRVNRALHFYTLLVNSKQPNCGVE